MIYKLLLFILGIILISISLVFTILYLNLLNMGYSFFDYVNFIIRRFECYVFIIGIILIIISMRKEKTYDIHL